MRALIEDVIAHFQRHLESAESERIAAFVRLYLKDVDPEDIAERNIEDLYGAVLSHWRFAERFTPGVPGVRVFNPVVSEHGWQCRHTVVEIVNDDMPFLVDSVTMEINRQGLSVHALVHPVMRMRRGGDGRLIGASADQDGRFESFIHAEVDRRDDPAARDALADGIRRVLRDVRAAVADWKPMLRRVEEAIAESERHPSPEDTGQVAEEREFLRWIGAGNFTFLGCRGYDLVEEGEQDMLRVVPDSGLGILRDGSPEGVSASFAMLPQEVRALARAPRLLILTKSNTRSTVHRPGYLDYVGVRRFDAEGRVIGEHRFLGLFTSVAYNANPSVIPVLRRKISRVIERAGLMPGSHAGKAMLTILEQYPRDELFQIEEEELLANALGILRLGERQRLRLFVRRDPWGRFVSCLLYVSRDKYNTELRERMQDILQDAFGGSSSEFFVQLAESMLARVLIIVRTPPGTLPAYDVRDLESQLAHAARRWEDDLQEALAERFGEERGAALFARYGGAFPAGYREDTTARAAVYDIELMEGLDESDGVAMNLYVPLEAGERELRFKLIRDEAPIVLSDSLPMLERMGVRVIEERPSRIECADRCERWIHDFGLSHPGAAAMDLHALRPLFHEAFRRSWLGESEIDDFNRLVLAAGLDWRRVSLLRAYAKYARQAGFAFSQGYIEQALGAHPGIAAALVALFEARFDPARADGRAACEREKRVAIESALEAVSSLDEDRILRHVMALILATLRTNFFQRAPDGRAKPWIALKFASREIPGLPEPRPLYEIYVHSPRFEGIHLRGGKVARGGLRWSDRMEDFRTEVLGLVKAQIVKNAVIVPVGSKGGFVLKRAPAEREALAREAVSCYQDYLRGLLDLTDNLVSGSVVPPRDVVRHDDDDPYLVVAADKGTATFSDQANAVSREYGFWLGDAFASGGSAGYDHKRMGITARGAWESARRHLREMGIDVDRDDFTVVGIGDMSGDVFGNGMLLSPHIRLVAAFDHRHVFVDPSPDAAASFAERQRVFALPRSSWADYDTRLISAGGGVWPRSAKSIALSLEARAALGITAAALSPAELVRAILRAPVDLLYNGGIGTYVKAADESHAEIGDRGNDAVRVDAGELRCRALVEGGNLGVSQRGRIEYALAGGRINTDAIDNSGGVDCSDHEVNLKILLDAVVADGELTGKQRNALLAEMTEEVAGLVLEDNRLQNRALQLACAQGVAQLDAQERLIRRLEKGGRLSRALEFLPDDEEIARRRTAGVGLTSPENAVLLAYAKLELYDLVLASDVPDDPYFGRELAPYFPEPVRRRYGEAVVRHPLRREIISTRVINELVNRVGATFVHRLAEETGAGAADIVRAYVLARDVFEAPRLWPEVAALDARVPAALQTEMLTTLVRLVGRGVRWFMRRPARLRDLESAVGAFAPSIASVAEQLPKLLADEDRAALEEAVGRLAGIGVPEPLATRISGFEALYSSLDVAQLSLDTGWEAAQVAALYFLLAGRLELRWAATQIAQLPAKSQWQGLARSALRDEFAGVAAEIARSALGATRVSPAEAVQAWEAPRAAGLARYRQLCAELRQSAAADLAMLSVLLRELRGLLLGP